MNAAWVVFLKEVRDNLRDRRTLMSALIFGPIFGPVFFSLLMGVAIQKQMDGVDEDIDVLVKGEQHAPEWLAQLAAHGVNFEQADGDIRALLTEDDERVVLEISADFQQALDNAERALVSVHYDGANDKADRKADRLKKVLQAWSSKMASLRLSLRGIDGQVIEPLRIVDEDISTAASRAIIIFSMLPYFVLLAGILGCFYLAIDATAGERERGSLESLLSLPVDRGQLVGGKILAAVLFSAVSLAITIGIFALAMPRIGLDAIGVNASLSMAQIAKILAATLPFSVFAAGLLTFVASFAKSYKEAQTYLSVVMLVPLIPVIFSSIKPMDLTFTAAAIPGLSQHLLVIEVIKGAAVDGSMIAVSAITTILLGVVMALASVYLYRSERILG